MITGLLNVRCEKCGHHEPLLRRFCPHCGRKNRARDRALMAIAVAELVGLAALLLIVFR